MHKVVAILMASAGAAVLAASPAGAVTFTSAQLASANSGLQAMRELNTIVFGNLTSSQEIEGKTFVGGNLSGQSNYGIGNSSATQTQSNRAVLTVGGTLSGNVTIDDGPNGSNGTIVQSSTDNVVKVGGNSTGTITMNSATASQTGKVMVGGSFNNQNFNPNASKTVAYGTTASNVQSQDTSYVKKDATLAAGGSKDLAAAILSETNTLKTNLTQLSSVLSELNTNATLNLSDRNNISINYGAAASSANYVVVNVAGNDLFNGGGTLNLNLLSSGSSYKTTVINVTGSGNWTYSINNNDNQNSNDQNIIWNFNQAASTATSLALNSAFHGSILAPNLSLSNATAVEGSVVAQLFNQNGEVHLGTFAGTSAIVANNAAPTGAVPEPESWAMMMIGFGLIGGVIRRQRREGALLHI